MEKYPTIARKLGHPNFPCLYHLHSQESPFQGKSEKYQAQKLTQP